MRKPCIIPISKHARIAESDVLALSESPGFFTQTRKWANCQQVNFHLEDSSNYGYSHIIYYKFSFLLGVCISQLPSPSTLMTWTTKGMIPKARIDELHLNALLS